MKNRTFFRRTLPAALLLIAAALMAGCATSREFPKQNQGGNYEFPDVVVPASDLEARPLPRELDCTGRLVVYAAALERVPNCANAGAATARAIAKAATRAATYADRSVSCKKPCVKQTSFIWAGWKCGGNPIAVVAAVEVLVECVLREPGPGDVSP